MRLNTSLSVDLGLPLCQTGNIPLSSAWERRASEARSCWVWLQVNRPVLDHRAKEQRWIWGSIFPETASSPLWWESTSGHVPLS